MTTRHIYIDLKRGETLVIGGATVRLEQKSGQVARLLVEASDETVIKTPGELRRIANNTRGKQ